MAAAVAAVAAVAWHPAAKPCTTYKSEPEQELERPHEMSPLWLLLPVVA